MRYRGAGGSHRQAGPLAQKHRCERFLPASRLTSALHQGADTGAHVLGIAWHGPLLPDRMAGCKGANLYNSIFSDHFCLLLCVVPPPLIGECCW